MDAAPLLAALRGVFLLSSEVTVSYCEAPPMWTADFSVHEKTTHVAVLEQQLLSLGWAYDYDVYIGTIVRFHCWIADVPQEVP